MYELRIGGKVIESPYLSAITTALLIDNFERCPEPWLIKRYPSSVMGH